MRRKIARNNCKRRCLTLFFAFLLIFSSLPISAFADEILIEDIEQEESTSEEKEESKEEVTSDNSVESVVKLIDSFDGNTSLDDLATVLEAYENLTDAQKTQVTNADLLISKEKELTGDSTVESANRLDADADSVKSGTTYTLNGDDTANKMLTVSYASTNPPTIKIINPQNVAVTLTDEISEFNDNAEITIERTSESTKLTIASLGSGLWTIEASEEVTYELSDLTSTTAIQGTDAETESGSDSKILILYAVIVLLVIVIIIFALIFVGGKFKTKKAEKIEEAKKLEPIVIPPAPAQTADELFKQVRSTSSWNDLELNDEETDEYLSETIYDLDEDENVEDI